MSQSPQCSAVVDPRTLSRRELQYLARELELCRGNAKSDVIVEHLVAFVADKGTDAVREALDNMPADIKLRTPGATSATPVERTRAQGDQVTPRSMDFSDDATPLRRSVRKSPRTATPSRREQIEQKNTSTRSVVRTMQFVSGPTKADEDSELAQYHESPVAEPTSSSIVSPINSSPKKAAKDVSLLHSASSEAVTAPSLSTANKYHRSPLADVANTPSESRHPPSDVAALVSSACDLVFVDADCVKCVTTGHEMKADYEVITTYISGKRYRRAQKQKKSFAVYAPMFVDHPDESKPHMLWCSVTRTAIPRDVERVEAHINGARYQKQLPQWHEDQEALKEGAKKPEVEREVDGAARKRKAPHHQRGGVKVGKR